MNDYKPIVWKRAIRNKVLVGEMALLYAQSKHFEYIHNSTTINDGIGIIQHNNIAHRPVEPHPDDIVYEIEISGCVNASDAEFINIMNYMLYCYCERNRECIKCEIAKSYYISSNKIKVTLYCDDEDGLRQFMNTINQKSIIKKNIKTWKQFCSHFSLFENNFENPDVLNVIDVKNTNIKNPVSSSILQFICTRVLEDMLS